MSRYTLPKCRLCRRDGVKLFLKGARCLMAKCPIEKRSKPPGMHAFRRRRPTAYGIRLREKQKLRRFYGVSEAQFRRYFEMARKYKGNTGEALLAIMERRLDNVLKAAGFALSRSHARQLVRHGRIQVNGRKVNVPSFQVKQGDVVRPEPTEAMAAMVRACRDDQGNPKPAWLDINETDLTARVVRLPLRADISATVEEGLVVEFCSR